MIKQKEFLIIRLCQRIAYSFDVKRFALYYGQMIMSFLCRDTAALFEGKIPRRFRAIAIVATRKLQILDNACAIVDLRCPPGNRLEALSDDRKGTWSIRMNDRWRICFRFKEGNAFDVEIVDYH